MGSNFRLRRLRPDELSSSFLCVCSRGKPTIPDVVVGHHEVRPVFEFAFEYIAGKSRRQATRTFQLCELHAREVAKKYQLVVPAENDEPCRRDPHGYPPRRGITCKCGKPGLPLHPCPYDEDLHNDKRPTCNCCQACQDECAQEL